MSKFNMNTIVLKGLENLSDDEDVNMLSDEHNENEKVMKVSRIKSSVLQDQKFLNIIAKIDNSNELDNKAMYLDIYSSINLISDCNKYVNDINTDINLLIKYIKDIYAQRFPELESIILNPYTYALTVKRLGNDIDVTKKNLTDILPNNNIMSINMISSTTSGKPMNKDDLNDLYSLCDQVIELNAYKDKILDFIERKISSIAPNLTALLGSNISAKLIIAAGGLVELSKIPACNVLVIGAQRINTEGFSTAGKLHRGYLAELEEVKNTPEEYQTQLLRKYAGKCVLAARVDAYRRVSSNKDEFNLNANGPEQNINVNTTAESNTAIAATEGEKFKDFIGKKMEKIKEPKAPALKKPLPRPDDKPRTKRGGKRARGQKKRLEQTQMRALKNRMKFGEAESEFRETGKGFGMLGVAGAIKVNVKETKINTKKQKEIAMQSQVEQQKSGLYSTVSFTPTEGIKLINPELLEKRLDHASEKYFNSTSGFSTVINAKKKDGNTVLNLSTK
jgi:U4/U6 small nuclear ribonucleoprotein PRP31